MKAATSKIDRAGMAVYGMGAADRLVNRHALGRLLGGSGGRIFGTSEVSREVVAAAEKRTSQRRHSDFHYSLFDLEPRVRSDNRRYKCWFIAACIFFIYALHNAPCLLFC